MMQRIEKRAMQICDVRIVFCTQWKDWHNQYIQWSKKTKSKLWKALMKGIDAFLVVLDWCLVIGIGTMLTWSTIQLGSGWIMGSVNFSMQISRKQVWYPSEWFLWWGACTIHEWRSRAWLRWRHWREDTKEKTSNYQTNRQPNKAKTKPKKKA